MGGCLKRREGANHAFEGKNTMNSNEFLGNCVHCDALAYWNEEDKGIDWIRKIPGCGCELPKGRENWRRIVSNINKMYDLGRGKNAS